MIAAHLIGEPADLPAIDGVPFGIAELYRRCLDREPELRPTARDAADHLAAAAASSRISTAQQGQPPDSTQDMPTGPIAVASRRPSGWLVPVALGCVALIGAVLIGIVIGGSLARDPTDRSLTTLAARLQPRHQRQASAPLFL